jgi:hypothetical protein
MPFQVTLEIDDREFQRMVRQGDKIYRAAAASALNKAMAEVRTASARAIREKTRIPVRTVRRRMFIRRATTRNIIAQLKVYAKPINAAGLTRQRRHGAPVRVAAGHAMPPGSFLMRPVRGGVIVARRKSFAAAANAPDWLKRVESAVRGGGARDSKGRLRRGRLPVAAAKVKFFPEANQIVKAKLAEGGQAAFAKHLPHELEFRLQRAAKGG